jgi:DNA-binding response OmpR family regulator
MTRKTVLIADDEPSILISLEYLLEQAGYQVLTARDGQEALDLALEHRPHLLLLDVMMPRLNGFDVCARLRADPALAGLRVVMLTAKGRDVEISQGLSLGANAYVTKPFATRELMATIATQLAAR